MIQAYNNSQDILNHFRGQGRDTSEVLINYVLDTEERIEQKKEISQMFNRLKIDPGYNNFVRLHNLNAYKIQKIVLACTGVGVAVGCIFSSIFSGSMTLQGGAIGGTVGLGLGVGYCVKNDLFSEASKDKKLVELKIDEKLESFRNEYTVDQYNLFKNLLLNYIKFVDVKFLDQFDDVFCSITKFIPDVPVFSPHDIARRHVFEKAAIEAHLDNVDQTISRAIASDAKPDVIANLRTTYCPFRGLPFTKNELVTDIRYLDKVIVLFKESLKSLSENVMPQKDPILQRGLQCLLNHYINNYNECTKVIVDKLFDDCVTLGTPRSLIRETCNAFEANFDEKKNI